MTERRRRLIEVAFPLEEVSAHSRREKKRSPWPHLHPAHLVGGDHARWEPGRVIVRA